MAKSFFDLRDDIFETLTEASALERRADREQKQADMAKVAAEQDRKRRRAREARQDYRRDRKRALELESFKVGDSVHLGHATKGGTGVKGKVHKIDGKTVHIKNDKGDTFKGPMDRVSTAESFEKLTPAQERDAERRLKPTRATVAKVRLRATDAEVADKVKKHQSEKGGNPGNTKKRRLRDLRAKLRDHVELDELKKSTLQSYKDKAKQDKADIARRNQSVRGPLVGRDRRDFRNRAKGVDAATRRLVARQYQPESAELEEAHAKDIVKGLTDMDGPFTVVAIKNNKVIKQEGTKMRNMLPAIVKMMRKEVGRGVTIGIEDRKGTIRNTFKEDVEQIDELSPTKLKKYSARSLRDREDAVRQGYDPSTGQLDPKSERRRKKRLAGFSKAKKKLVAAAEDVEQVDELKMPEKDKRGRIKNPIVRAAVKQGYHKADLKADKALRNQDAEGAEGHMTRAGKRKRASKEPVGESAGEDLNELKSSTLRSYLDKARKQNQTRVTRMADQPDHMPSDKGEMRKLRKRRKGSEAAASRLDARKHNLEPRLKREEIEQVDELDTETMKSYIHKASGQVRSDLSTGKHSPKTNKRAKGVAKAKTDLDMRKIAGKDYRKRMG